jgi:hypothetical protein
MRIWITETMGGFVDIDDNEKALESLIELAEKEGIEGVKKVHYFKSTHRHISVDED